MPDSFTPPIQAGVMRQLWRCQRRRRLTAAGSDELTEAAAHMDPPHPSKQIQPNPPLRDIRTN